MWLPTTRRREFPLAGQVCLPVPVPLRRHSGCHWQALASLALAGCQALALLLALADTGSHGVRHCQYQPEWLTQAGSLRLSLSLCQ